MRTKFTNEGLKALRIEAGRKKATVTDTLMRGLQYEQRPGGGYFYYRYSHDGRQRTFTIGKFGIVSIADARKRAANIARAVALGEDPLSERNVRNSCPTLDSFFQTTYLPFAKVNKRSASVDARFYRNHLEAEFGRLKLNQISRVQINRLLQAKRNSGLAPATVNRILILLRFVLNKAIEWETPGLRENPAQRIRTLPENNRRERYLTPEEALRLRDVLEQHPDQTLSFALKFLLLTGARRQEALCARWADIDFERRIWRVPLSKSGKCRHIMLSNAALDCLQGVRDYVAEFGTAPQRNSALIFPAERTGKHMVTVYHHWNKIRRKAGLADLRMHDLRHSFASALVNNGVPLYEVQKLLGHASIRTTERYAHLNASRLVESAAVAGTYYSNILR